MEHNQTDIDIYQFFPGDNIAGKQGSDPRIFKRKQFRGKMMGGGVPKNEIDIREKEGGWKFLRIEELA